MDFDVFFSIAQTPVDKIGEGVGVVVQRNQQPGQRVGNAGWSRQLGDHRLGCRPVQMGPRILRVENAVNSLLARLY